MKYGIRILLFGALAVLGAPAESYPITYFFGGEFSYSTVVGLKAGDIFLGGFVIDSNAVDQSPGLPGGNYLDERATLFLPALNILSTTDGAYDDGVTVVNNAPVDVNGVYTFDRFIFSHSLPNQPTPGLRSFSFVLDSDPFAPSVFDNENLPLHAPPLDAFRFNVFQVQFNNDGERCGQFITACDALGSLSFLGSVPVAVAEPESFALVATACLLLTALVSRRKRTAKGRQSVVLRTRLD